MIHILTLNWNGLDKLKNLEPGLGQNLIYANQNAKWYIKDNGSKDGSIKWINNWNESNKISKNFPIEMVPFLEDHNRDNFAQGINKLWLATNITIEKEEYNQDYILLLNNDIEFVDKESLNKMINIMNNDHTVGIVGARLLYNKTTRLQHAGVIFGRRYNNMPFHFRHKEFSDKMAEKNRYFQAVTAACCLIRVNAFKKMDEKFSWAFEDIDLCLRIGKKWKIAYCGETYIYHAESASLKKNPVNKLFLRNNVKHFKDKWFGKYELDHEKYLNNPDYNLIK